MRILVALLLVLSFSGSVFGARGEGTAGGILARLPVGARSQALGGANGTLPGSPESLVVNPASLAMMDTLRIQAAYHQGLEDIYYSGVLVGAPLNSWLVVGGGVEMLSAGTIEMHDHLGNALSAALEEDQLGIVAATFKLGGFSAGVSGKYCRSVLVETEESSFFLGDAGIGVRVEFEDPDRPWLVERPSWIFLGMSLCNLGPNVRYDTPLEVADLPPTSLRLGVSAARRLAAGRTVLGTAALDVPQHTARPEVRCGLEIIWPVESFEVFTRVGVRGRQDAGQFSAGLGFRYLGLDLDYAYVSARAPFNSTHHVSLVLGLAGFLAPAPL